MRPLRRLAAAGRLTGYYLWSFLQANALVTWEILTPTSGIAPGIVRVPVRLRKPWHVVLYANLISLTPGTLTLDVTEDCDTLLVHGLHVESADALRAHLAELEDRLLEVLE